MKAVFVDGMGKTRDYELENQMATVRVPIVDSGSGFGAVDFQRLGILPDGRHVYAQSGMGLRLWSVQSAIDTLLWSVHDNAITEARATMHRQIEAMSRGFIVTLYDGQQVMDDTQLLTIEIYGVAVPQETGVTP